MTWVSFAYADKPIPSPFPGLKTYTIAQSPPDSYSPPQQISYDPSVSKILNTRPDVEFNSQGIGGIEITRVLLTKIDRTKNDRYYIDFDPGASNDPVFAVFPEGGKSAIGIIDADHLVVPGNGFIYALARTNKHFLERRKYLIQDNKVIESKQPYLYVGLDTKANRNFPLYASVTGGETIASIRKGDKIFVVLNEGDNYLVRSSFGLLGWVQIDPGNQESAVIEGIYFAGD
jgi:hypothetical protein